VRRGKPLRILRVGAAALVSAIAVGAIVAALFLVNRVNTLERELLSLSDHSQRLADLETKATKVSELEAELFTLKAQVTGQDIKTLEVTVSALQDSYEKLEASQRTLEDAHWALTSQVDRLDYELSRPFSCGSGDVVVWDIFDGLSC
jgi:hypothetical protein